MFASGEEYDVIVVGAGHAGCEAALASARTGLYTAVFTISLDAIALMACNPAIGGPGKAQLVREVDALGGEMGLNADRTSIHVRMLNTGKGPAVRAVRAQCDKKAYQEGMRKALENQGGLRIKQGMVTRIYVEDGRVSGVRTATGMDYRARAVVLTTGVYLESRVIIGDWSLSSGPSGHLPSLGLSQSLRSLGLGMGRFKTGTPPRIDAGSVDFSKMIVQPGSDEPLTLSFLSDKVRKEQVPCYLTHTRGATHDLIRANLHRAPLYNGSIKSRGPRYCPSIEDKVVRFSEKGCHQVFLEHEGRNTREMYVLGLSTSLPEDVQVDLVRSITGLERAEILRPGYAIEYDYILPSELDRTLAVRKVGGLFAAGQVNGTSGYEEAAAQGIVAGINAGRYCNGLEGIVVDRSEGYTGVLIDDLVTKVPQEPYRMMTSRAEHRMLFRQDNADLRLTEIGWRLGLVTEARYSVYRKRRDMILEGLDLLKRVVRPGPEVDAVLRKRGSAGVRGPVDLRGLLKRPEMRFQDLRRIYPGLPDYPEDVIGEIEVHCKYEGFLAMEAAQVERFKRMEDKVLPKWMDFGAIPGVSTEGREKLSAIRPVSVGQAMRIPGVSSADIGALLVYVEVSRRRGKTG